MKFVLNKFDEGRSNHILTQDVIYRYSVTKGNKRDIMICVEYNQLELLARRTIKKLIG